MEPNEMPTANEVIAGYMKLKAHKESIEKRHKEELAPIHENLFKLQNFLQKTLLEMGLQNLKGDDGTAYLETKTRVTVDDSTAMLAFMQQQNRFDLLEQRVSQSVALEYLEQTGELPPGTVAKSEITCRIRKT
jgi:hypothetical protein